jgi:hypothetical protein
MSRKLKPRRRLTMSTFDLLYDLDPSDDKDATGAEAPILDDDEWGLRRQ